MQTKNGNVLLSFFLSKYTWCVWLIPNGRWLMAKYCKAGFWGLAFIF